MPEKTVTIKLAGDASNLNNALRESLRSVQEFGGTLEKVGRSQGIAFSSALQQDVKQLEVLRDHLVKINAPAADLEKVTNKLTEAQLKFKDSLKTDAMRAQEAALESLRGKYVAHEVSLSALGKTVTDNRAGFQALGGVLTGVGTAITASLGLAFNEFNKFNQGMREVNSLVNLGENEFKTLSQQVVNLSSKLGTDATDAVHGLYEALSAGVPTENAIDFLEVASKAAIAGVTDTKVAVDGLTTVINSWKLSAADADKVADQMFVTVKLGKTTFAELAASLSTVAPIAAATGVSFKEVMGAVTTLTKQGVPTAEAMTQIRASIVGIITPNKELAELFKKIGVASGETLIKTRGLQGAYEDLAKASGGSNEVLTKALGRVEALGAVLSTTGQNAQGARQDLDAVGKSADAMRTAFEEMQKGRAVELLLTQFKNLSIEIGAKLQPAISAMLPAISKVVGSIIEWVQQNPTLTASIVTVGGAIGGFMLAVGPLLFALPSIVEGFGLMKGALTAVGPAMTGLFSSVGNLGTGFGQLEGFLGRNKLAIGGVTLALAGLVFGPLINDVKVFGVGLGDLAIAAGGFLTVLPSLIGGIKSARDAIAGAGGVTQIMTTNWGALTTAVQGLTLSSFTGPITGMAGLALSAAGIAALAVAFWKLKDAIVGWYEASVNAGVAVDNQNAKFMQLSATIAQHDKATGQAVKNLTQGFNSGKISAEQYAVGLAKIEGESRKTHPELWKVAAAAKAIAAPTLNAAQAAAALAAKQVAQAEAAKKAAAEIQSWGNAIGVTIPKLRQTVAEGEKYLAYLKRNKASAEEVKEAERKLQDARLALTKATSPLIAETEKLLAATKDLDKAEISNISTLAAAQRQALASIQTLRNLGVVVGTELPAEFGKPTTAILNLAASFKTLGITSDEVLRNQVSESTAAYQSITASGTASAREVALAWVSMTEAQITATRDAGGQIDQETLKAVESIKAKYGTLKGDKDANLSSWRELASRQVSTVITDFAKGFTDILFSAGSFGGKLIGLFRQIGESITRAWIESGVVGILSGQGFKGFSGYGQGLFDAIKGKAPRTANTGFNLAGLAPNVAKLFGFGTAAATTAATTGIISGAAFAPAVGGSLASIASAGTVPGFLLAGGTVAGTAGAAGVGSGLATGSAVGGAAGGSSLGATLGALATNPITIAAAAAIAAGIIGYKAYTNTPTEAGVKELKRDFGGVEMEEDDLKKLLPSLGLTSDTFKPIRKDVLASPLFLTQIAGPLAEAQGKTDAFLKSLESVGTAWGTFDFRTPFEIGKASGDFTLLNEAFEAAFKSSQNLVSVMPDFASKLAAVATEGSELWKTFETLKTQFEETGIVTDEFRKFIDDLGLDFTQLDDLARIPNIIKAQEGFAGLREELLKMKSPAETMFEQFMNGSVITDDFRKAIEEAGESVDSFTKFAEAKEGLFSFRGGIGSLIGELEKMSPALKTNVESFLELGQITPELREEAIKLGVSIEDLAEFSSIRRMTTEFSGLRDQILQTGEGAAALKPIFENFGVDTSALDTFSEKFKALHKQQSEFSKLQSELAKIAPPTTAGPTDIERFLQSGQMSEMFVQQLTTMGADISKFSGFSSARSASIRSEDLTKEFEKTHVITTEMKDFAQRFGTVLTGSTAHVSELLKQLQTQTENAYKNSASALGVEVMKLQETTATEIQKLQAGLETSLDLVATRLEGQFEQTRNALLDQLRSVDANLTGAVDSARDGLVDVLGKIDSSLTTTMNSLREGVVDSLNQVAIKLGGMTAPTPIDQTTGLPYQAPTTEYSPISTEGSQQPDNFDYTPYWMKQGQFGGAFAEGGEGIVRKPTIFLAGEAGAERFSFTPLAKIAPSLKLQQQYGQSQELQRISEMAIMPAALERIQFSIARLESGRGSSTVDNSRQNTNNVSMPIHLYGGGNDPFALRRESDRMMAELVNRLNV